MIEIFPKITIKYIRNIFLNKHLMGDSPKNTFKENIFNKMFLSKNTLKCTLRACLIVILKNISNT